MEFAEMKKRYDQLYTAVVSDIMDGMGYRKQCFPGEIQAIQLGMRLFGEAFTFVGKTAVHQSEDDIPLRAKMLGEVLKNSIAVCSSQGNHDAAHWGEITGLASRNAGCLGAVVDGGTRDVRPILDYGLTVFCRHRSPASSTGRWSVYGWQVPVTIGEVQVRPGDYIMGDEDGVVCIPRHMAEDVLFKAEEKRETEKAMREALASGKTIGDVYSTFGRF